MERTLKLNGMKNGLKIRHRNIQKKAVRFKSLAFASAERIDGQIWEESWGEVLDAEGNYLIYYPLFSSGKIREHWASKWEEDQNESRHGKNWGSKIIDSSAEHVWGENWENQNVEKWSFNRPLL